MSLGLSERLDFESDPDGADRLHELVKLTSLSDFR